MKGFLAGIVAGVTLGILFAPRSGEETRDELRTAADDLIESAKEQSERLKSVAPAGTEQESNTAG